MANAFTMVDPSSNKAENTHSNTNSNTNANVNSNVNSNSNGFVEEEEDGGSSNGVVVPSTEPQVAVSVPVQSADAKIDDITALQDSIDGLSLAMFEALRGLRDAVAPGSGNSASINNNNAAAATATAAGENSNSNSNNNNNNNNNTEDFEEFWQLYRNNDPDVVSAVHKRNHGHPPLKREDYRRIFALVEREKDAELVAKLATTVLQKSAMIDARVAGLLLGKKKEKEKEKEKKGSETKERTCGGGGGGGGNATTRAEQLERMRVLMEENAVVEKELVGVYEMAKKKRDEVRRVLQEQTCAALGIEEYKD